MGPSSTRGSSPFSPKKKRLSDRAVSEEKSSSSYSLSDEPSDWTVSDKKSPLSDSLSDEQNSSKKSTLLYWSKALMRDPLAATMSVSLYPKLYVSGCPKAYEWFTLTQKRLLSRRLKHVLLCLIVLMPHSSLFLLI